MKLTAQQITLIANSVDWSYFAEGSYNILFISKAKFRIDAEPEDFWILKIPKTPTRPEYRVINSCDRAVRKWREINPYIPAYLISSCQRLPERYTELNHQPGWIVRYLGKTLASDNSAENLIVRTYQNTGNRILDGCIATNILQLEGQAVCVDVDLCTNEYSDNEEVIEQIIKSKEKEFYDKCRYGYKLRVMPSDLSALERGYIYYKYSPRDSNLEYAVIGPYLKTDRKTQQVFQGSIALHFAIDEVQEHLAWLINELTKCGVPLYHANDSQTLRPKASDAIQTVSYIHDELKGVSHREQVTLSVANRLNFFRQNQSTLSIDMFQRVYQEVFQADLDFS